MKTLSEKEMRELAAEVRPFLEKLLEIRNKYGIDEGSLSIYSMDDGMISLDGTGMAGWRLYRMPDGQYEISYSYSSRIKED